MKNKTKQTYEKRSKKQSSNRCVDTIKLGLDIHADSIVVVRILDHSSPQPAQKFTPEKFRQWVVGQLQQAKAVHSCYEAGPFGYGLHRFLTDNGIKNVVIQPVCLDERNKGVKHDKRDAKELAMRLDRYVYGNTHSLASVRVPTPEQERKRIESRQREQLKRQLQRVGAQGRSLLLTQGYREKKGWWMNVRWQKLQEKLPPWLTKALEVLRRIIQSIEKELKEASCSLEQAAPINRPKGLGAMTYEIMEREVGCWDRFENRRQVSSYTGLCGGIRSSGNTLRLLPITKHGNARLRTVLIELAWRLFIWQPNCRLVQKWVPILSNLRATKAAKKKCIVAIARQLAVDIWRWRTGRVKPEDLGWEMLEA